MWNHDVSDTKEVERMAALYDEDGTRAVEPGAEVETGRNLVRRCGNELGIATWEVYDFDPDTWTCEAFSNREAAELWLARKECSRARLDEITADEAGADAIEGRAAA